MSSNSHLPNPLLYVVVGDGSACLGIRNALPYVMILLA